MFKNNSVSNTVDQIGLYSFYLAVFFLPLSMYLNNFFITVFILVQCLGFLFFNFRSKIEILKNSIKGLLIIALPFFMILIGDSYSEHISSAVKDTIRALPLLILPFSVLMIQKHNNSFLIEVSRYLIIGCVLASFICWINNIHVLYQSSLDWKILFSPQFANIGLTKILDIHPSYLALTVNSSIALLVCFNTSLFKYKTLLYFFTFILILFLFNLLSRSALAIFILGMLVFIILKKKWLLLGGLLTMLFGIFLLANNLKDNYLRDRLFKSLNFFEAQTTFSKKDSRFDRLNASYQVFLIHPLIGTGTADEDDLRKEFYKENRDVTAYQNNYNSHNQFFEYLSTYGLFGALVFILLITFVIVKSIQLKHCVYIFVFVSFFLSSMTESLLERTFGIVYFAIFASLLIHSINFKVYET